MLRNPNNLQILVVIPAFNEAESIGFVVTKVLAEGVPCLVVDDGSSDSTVLEATKAGATIVKMPFNSGVGGALRTGLLYAVRNGFEGVVQVDADGQHPPEAIKRLVQAGQKADADLVIGSRFLEPTSTPFNVGKMRTLAMRALARRASRATHTTITDATSGFRLIRGQLLLELSRKLPSYYLGDTFEALVAAGRSGYSVMEVPVQMSQREFGSSTASTRQAIKWSIRAFVTVILGNYPRLDPSHGSTQNAIRSK